MSRYTLIDIETTLDAVENTPRKSLPWHSSYGQVKKNKENFAQFCGDNIGQFGGGVAKKSHNPDSISACAAKWSDPATDNSIGELSLKIFAAKAKELGISLRDSYGNINPVISSGATDVAEIVDIFVYKFCMAYKPNIWADLELS